MKLIDIITAAEGRICGGDSFQWSCWGDNARFMQFADVGDQEFCSVIFDSKTYNVYDIELFVPGTDFCFKWLNPEFKNSYLQECRVRDVNPMIAWDDVEFREIANSDIAMQYLKDLANGVYENLPFEENML